MVAPDASAAEPQGRPPSKASSHLPLSGSHAPGSSACSLSPSVLLGKAACSASLLPPPWFSPAAMPSGGRRRAVPALSPYLRSRASSPPYLRARAVGTSTSVLLLEHPCSLRQPSLSLRRPGSRDGFAIERRTFDPKTPRAKTSPPTRSESWTPAPEPVHSGGTDYPARGLGARAKKKYKYLIFSLLISFIIRILYTETKTKAI